MAKDFNYVTVDYILSQLARIPHYTINEDDVITDISIALGFMVKNATQEEATVILPVRNNIAELGVGYSQIQRISRYNGNHCVFEDESLLDFLTSQRKENCIDCDTEPTPEEIQQELQAKQLIAFKYPYFGLFNLGYFKQAFTPVKPATNTFFSSLVCNDELSSELYSSSCCVDEYSIKKGLNKRILLSFSEGYIAVSIKRPLTDDSTGFPLVPDDSNANEAILSFLKAKIFEQLSYAGREGYYTMAQNERISWGKYLKQFNNAAKMPQSEDDFQSQLETTLGSYPPNRNHYYGNMARISRRRRLK